MTTYPAPVGQDRTPPGVAVPAAEPARLRRAEVRLTRRRARSRRGRASRPGSPRCSRARTGPPDLRQGGQPAGSAADRGVVRRGGPQAALCCRTPPRLHPGCCGRTRTIGGWCSPPSTSTDTSRSAPGTAGRARRVPGGAPPRRSPSATRVLPRRASTLVAAARGPCRSLLTGAGTTFRPRRCRTGRTWPRLRELARSYARPAGRRARGPHRRPRRQPDPRPRRLGPALRLELAGPRPDVGGLADLDDRPARRRNRCRRRPGREPAAAQVPADHLDAMLAPLFGYFVKAGLPSRSRPRRRTSVCTGAGRAAADLVLAVSAPGLDPVTRSRLI